MESEDYSGRFIKEILQKIRQEITLIGFVTDLSFFLKVEFKLL